MDGPLSMYDRGEWSYGRGRASPVPEVAFAVALGLVPLALLLAAIRFG